MPIRLPTRTITRVSIAIGITMLIFYWDSIMRTLDNTELSAPGEISASNRSMLTAVTLSFMGQLMILFSATKNNPVFEIPKPINQKKSAREIELQQIKQKLSKLIIIDSERAMDYSSSEEKLDKNFIVKALLEMYQENHIDHCKIICLLDKNKFEFKIRLMPIEKVQTLEGTKNIGGIAFYSINEEIVTSQKIYKENLSMLKQVLSHELNHAIYAYDNKQTGRWPIMHDNKLRHRIYMWGAPKEVLPGNGFAQEVLQEFAAVKKIVNEDIDNVLALHKALDNPSSRSQAQQEKLSQLLAMVEAYDYNYTLTSVIIRAFHEHLPKPTPYKRNPLTDRYHPTQNFLSLYFDNEEYNVIEYMADPNMPLVAILTDSNDPSNDRRLKDLFLNLEFRINRVKNRLANGDYVGLSGPSEYVASLDEVLAPFSHTLPDSELTLRDILFPGLVKIEKERQSEEHRRCLAKPMR